MNFCYDRCPVCDGTEFSFAPVLWGELIADWELEAHEVDYINCQQGLVCKSCGNNLRSMAIASAILQRYQYADVLDDFVSSDIAQSLEILEINEAGGLTPYLSKIPKHKLIKYPEFDMTNLALDSEAFDLVIHSDSLEHVSDPLVGLSECLRVLKKRGRCIFTVPIIWGRMSRARIGMKASYHGEPSQSANDYRVVTEFGADVWRYVIEAGFAEVRIHNFDYPAAFVIEAVKRD